MNHLTSSLAVTFAKRFVTVNAICPGVFPSKMTAFGVKKAGGVEAMGQDNPFSKPLFTILRLQLGDVNIWLQSVSASRGIWPG